ncbi:MAG: energy transducer TonB [Gammaproteobacteria bacterium]|nr:energy transducer TonB [Gammaproteobacteria bacterium]
MSRTIGLILCIIATNAASAEESAPASNFNIAWQAYSAAADSRNPLQILQAAEEAFSAAERELLPSDARYPLVAKNYGESLLNAGDIERAREVLTLAVERYVDHAGPDAAELVPLYLQVAEAHEDLAAESGPTPYLERALAISAAHHGEASIEYANTLLRAGKIGYRAGPYARAETLLTSAYDSFALHLGKDSLQAGEAAYHLGLVAFDRQKFRTAESFFLAALGGFDATNPIGRSRNLDTREYLVKTYEFLGESASATHHCLEIGRIREDVDADPVPLFRQPATYPIDMLARRKEGHVDVGFTVDERGFVRNARILTSSGEPRFEKAALAAVKRFRYAPLFANGAAVETEHVRTRITFELE